MEFNFLNGNLIASLENGDWVYKSNNTPLKINSVLKAEYKDLPRYKVITEYEEDQINQFQNSLNTAIKYMAIKLKSF